MSGDSSDEPSELMVHRLRGHKHLDADEVRLLLNIDASPAHESHARLSPVLDTEAGRCCGSLAFSAEEPFLYLLCCSSVPARSHGHTFVEAEVWPCSLTQQSMSSARR